MFLRLLRQTHWLALAGASATSACSGNKPEVADAFVASTVQDTTTGGTCNVMSQTTIVDVGGVTGGKPSTVQNNGTQLGGGTVSVSCSVVASNGGFDVELDAEEVGVGNLRVSSKTGAGAVTLTGGTVSVTFTNVTNAGSYTESDCTVTYTYQGTNLSDPTLLGSNPPVAPGRIWAHISCPTATDSSSSPPAVCDGEADILFENCAQ